MEKYKNVSEINEVKKVLGEFQELYNQKKEDELQVFVRDKFSYTNGIVVLGSDMNQWCYSENEIKELIKTHWKTEDNYWKQVDFKFGEAKVYADENIAWVISIGNIKNTISEDIQLENTIKKVNEIIEKEEISKEDVLNAASKIAKALKEIEQGEDYVWPIRFTSVLIKEEDSWKFHQMQFSFDSENWNYRYLDENYDKNIFEMTKANLDVQAEEIKKVLRVFQEGYVRRDLDHVEEYMKEVFLSHEELVVIGTDAEELCLGIDATRNIIQSDWKYWGDFKFNLEDALISVNKEVAYFTTKAILSRVVSSEQTLQWIKNGAKYIFQSKKTTKDKLLQALCDSLELLCENEKSEVYITPMRFSGVLVKHEGKWLIEHLQYSDYSSGMPDVRI